MLQVIISLWLLVAEFNYISEYTLCHGIDMDIIIDNIAYTYTSSASILGKSSGSEAITNVGIQALKWRYQVRSYTIRVRSYAFERRDALPWYKSVIQLGSVV